MVDKILVVNKNLVVVFFVSKPPVSVATDDGSAYKLAMSLVVNEFKQTFTDAA